MSEDTTFEELVENVKRDYPLEQFMADIAEITVERMKEYHSIVCRHIAQGTTSKAAIEKLASGELT